MTENNEVLFDRIGVCYIQRYWWDDETISGFWKLLRRFLAPNSGQAWFRLDTGQWIEAEDNIWEELKNYLLKSESVWAEASDDNFTCFKTLRENGRFSIFMDSDRFCACVEDGESVPGKYYVGFEAEWCWNNDANIIFTPHFRTNNRWPVSSSWAPPCEIDEVEELLTADQVTDILWTDYWVKVEDRFKALMNECELFRARIDLDTVPQQPTVFFYASPTVRRDNADLYLTGEYVTALDHLAQILLRSPDIRSLEISGGVMEGCLAVFNHSREVKEDYCLMIPLSGNDEDKIERQIQFISDGWQEIDFDATWKIFEINKKLQPHDYFYKVWNQSLTSASDLNEQLFSLLGQDGIQDRMFFLTHLLSGFLAKLQAKTSAGAMKRKQFQRDMEWTIRDSKILAQKKFTARKISGLEMMGHISDGYTRVYKEYEEIVGKGANEAEKLSEQIENVGQSLDHTAGIEERKRESARSRSLEREEKTGKLLNRVLALVAVLAAIPLLVGEYDTLSLASAFRWLPFDIEAPFSFSSFGLQFSFWAALMAFLLTIWALAKTTRRDTKSDQSQGARVAVVDDLSKELFDGYRGYDHPEMQKLIFAGTAKSSTEGMAALERVNKFDLSLAYAVADAIDQSTLWADLGSLPENDENWAEFMEKKVCSFVLLSDVYALRPEMLHLPITLGLYRFMYETGKLERTPVSTFEFEKVMMRFGYSDEEIEAINIWGQVEDHINLTAREFVKAYVAAGIDALHRTEFSQPHEG